MRQERELGRQRERDKKEGEEWKKSVTSNENRSFNKVGHGSILINEKKREGE